MDNSLILRIIELSKPEKIILFGSQANGTDNINSDIDLLVLIEGIENKRQMAQKLYKELMPFRVAIDLIIETPANYLKYKSEKSFIYYQIAKTGKTIYEKNGKRTDLA